MLLTHSESITFYRMWIPQIKPDTTHSTIKIRSPFRKESIPSFEIDLNRGMWYDFGLGEGGDVIDFLARMAGISTKQALQVFGNHSEYIKPIETEVVYNEEAIKDKTLYSHMLQRFGKKLFNELTDRKISQGVLDTHPVFTWNRVILFRFDMDDEAKHYKMIEYGKKKKFISSGATTLFPASSLARDSVILCEGELDALTLLSNGYWAVSGTGGAGAFKDIWKYFLSRKNVYIMYDNDAAGRKGARKVAEVLDGWANMVHIHDWGNRPDKFDVGDFAKAGEDFNKLIGDDLWKEMLLISEPW